jgi:hypothetical protein
MIDGDATGKKERKKREDLKRQTTTD